MTSVGAGFPRPGTGRSDPSTHHRRSIRLKGYDYGQAGAYFVTICAQDRACLFGEIVAGEMQANAAGRLVQAVWDTLPEHCPGVELDAFVVMPNHVHGILVIAAPPTPVGAGFPRPPGSAIQAEGTQGGETQGGETPPLPGVTAGRGTGLVLGRIVAYLKYQSTKGINEIRGSPGLRVWQRNYYEHVIRNEADLCRVRAYVESNPALWEHDQLHPDHPSKW